MTKKFVAVEQCIRLANAGCEQKMSTHCDEPSTNAMILKIDCLRKHLCIKLQSPNSSHSYTLS